MLSQKEKFPIEPYSDVVVVIKSSRYENLSVVFGSGFDLTD